MTFLIPVVVAAVLAGADPGFDTIYLQNGGRILGTIVEEDPGRGVTIQVPGGEVRTLPPGEVSRVEYRDGTVGALGSRREPPPAPPATPYAQPVPGPTETSPLPPPAPTGPGSGPMMGPMMGEPGPMVGYGPPAARPPSVIMLAGSLGFAAPGGSVEPGLAMSDFTSTQFLLGLEGGLRLSPSFLLGAYLDLGFGDSGTVLQQYCAANGTTCSTIGVKLGLMARYAFTPLAPQTAWVGIGTGVEVLSSAPDDPNFDGPSYSGREPLRLSVGYDLRGRGQVGLGLFATAGFDRYTEVDDGPGSSYSLPSTSSHTWIQAGVRLILFP
ncbi:MAG: hypothetical protein WCC48_19420 [Anaeromyxobacteraceae bacterium]